MSFDGKNALITGITGFVGSHLAKSLLDKGANVWGLARRRCDSTGLRNLANKGIQREVRLIEGDITDIACVGSAIRECRPDLVFHLAAQSYVPRSFTNPLETLTVNSMGTAYLLEAIRLQEKSPIVIFAGSSEEYGLVFSSETQYQGAKTRYGVVLPEPEAFPEVPTNENNPLRPISPYAVSKVQAEYTMRNYFQGYGLRDIVSRAFNHEGAGRGIQFVTSQITSQVMKLKLGETDRLTIGDVSSCRDWSHVRDIVEGYCLLAEKGVAGNTYVQGSMRTNSVLSYILISLQEAGWQVEKIATMRNNKALDDPAAKDPSPVFGLTFPKTKADTLILQGKLAFSLEDQGIWVYTDKGKVPIVFDAGRFRPAEVPLLLSDISKIRQLGFTVTHSLEDIIGEQLDYYSRKENRDLES